MRVSTENIVQLIFIRYVYVKGTTILNVGTIIVYLDDMFRSDFDHLQVLESSYM